MARLNNGASSVNESPMEFSWDDGCGPVSPDSPFLQRQSNTRASKNSSQAYSKAGFAGQKSAYTSSHLSAWRIIANIALFYIGTSSELDSPTKNTLPGLRKPEGQTYLFSSQATPSANKFRTPSFTTPQHPIETDFSSGGEVSSPANAADSEGTPDYLPPISRMGGKGNKDLVKFENGKSSKKPQPSSPLGRLRRQYTDVMARRVAKRRKRDADTDVGSRRSSEDSSDGQVRSGQGKRMGIIPSILTFIDAHPGLPNTLSIYVQFFLNVIFAFCLLYVGYGIYSTIRHDIDEKALIESSEIMAEMASCMHNYHANKCERASRVPAMEADCNAWAKCMERDPLKVGRSRLSAGMFAEIFNSFIEPISLKAIVSLPRYLYFRDS